MQTRSSDENSVCLSVCLSVCPSVRRSVTRVDCDKTVERSVQIYIPYERTFPQDNLKLGQRWANEYFNVGPMLANNVGPT